MTSRFLTASLTNARRPAAAGGRGEQSGIGISPIPLRAVCGGAGRPGRGRRTAGGPARSGAAGWTFGCPIAGRGSPAPSPPPGCGGRQGPTGIRRQAADPIQPALFNAYAARVHGETTGKRKGRVCTMLTRRSPPAPYIIADTGKEDGKAAGKAAGPAAWKNNRPGADAMICGKGRNPGKAPRQAARHAEP